MFYEFPLTIAAGTTLTAPVSQEVKLTHGLIDCLEVEFPDGCDGLVHVRILRFTHQVWPTNSEWFTSNDHVIVIPREYFQLYGSPYVLKLEGWSEALLYPHTVTIRIGMLPQAVADYIYGKMTKSDLALLREAFGLPAEE